jgi:hypothetical protein
MSVDASLMPKISFLEIFELMFTQLGTNECRIYFLGTSDFEKEN